MKRLTGLLLGLLVATSVGAAEPGLSITSYYGNAALGGTNLETVCFNLDNRGLDPILLCVDEGSDAEDDEFYLPLNRDSLRGLTAVGNAQFGTAEEFLNASPERIHQMLFGQVTFPQWPVRFVRLVTKGSQVAVAVERGLVRVGSGAIKVVAKDPTKPLKQLPKRVQ